MHSGAELEIISGIWNIMLLKAVQLISFKHLQKE